jgi:Zn-dependent protease with chaperone function
MALLCLSASVVTGALAFGREKPEAKAQGLAAAQELPVPSSSPETRPAPQAPPNQTKTDEYRLSHERYEKAVAYSQAAYTLYFVSFFWGVLVLVVILRLGIAAKFRDVAERMSERRWVQGLVFVPLLLVSLDVLHLPLRAYRHWLSLEYEQSVEGWAAWLGDWGKAVLIGVGMALVLVLILSAVMRRSPRRWWVYFWFAALPVLLFFFFISPWFIDPLFNKFEPLADKHPDLVAAIENLTKHAGVPIPPNRMFLMKASEKTNGIDAYVTGVGASKRVVIWDTTIQKLSTDETLFVIGHELGHYVLGHIWKGFAGYAVLLLAMLYILFRGLHWALGRWSKDWKIYSAEDWVSLAVLLLLLQVVLFFASPVVNAYSRMQEHAADVYGLEVIHGIVPDSPEVAARAFQEMGEKDLADPNPSPFITFWLYSHPPLAERLVFAHNYDPWGKGEAPKYVK